MVDDYNRIPVKIWFIEVHYYIEIRIQANNRNVKIVIVDLVNDYEIYYVNWDPNILLFYREFSSLKKQLFLVVDFLLN